MRTHTTITRTGLATLAVGLCAAGLPSAASAAGRGGDDRAQTQISSRVQAKLRSVSRGLDRAEGHVEDGDAAKAASSLASVRRSLASAQRTTLRKVAAGAEGAEAGAVAVERAEHAVVATTASLYDGQTGDVVTAISTTLDAALDGRDALLAGVDALTDEQAEAYDRYQAKVLRDVAAETEDVADATADDELTSDATAALAEATTRLAAQGTAADGILPADATTDDEDAADDDIAALAAAVGEACGGRRRDADAPAGQDDAAAGGSGTTTGARFGGRA